MGSLFAALFAKTKNDEACNDNGCNFKKLQISDHDLLEKFLEHEGIGEKYTDYSVQSKFEVIFMFGIFTYFADAVFRFIVVLGLKYN